MNYDVIVLTEEKYVNPPKTDWYVEQVLKEDQLVMDALERLNFCLLYTSPSPRDGLLSRMPSSA